MSGSNISSINTAVNTENTTIRLRVQTTTNEQFRDDAQDDSAERTTHRDIGAERDAGPNEPAVDEELQQLMDYSWMEVRDYNICDSLYSYSGPGSE
jgi:hypothetical protein